MADTKTKFRIGLIQMRAGKNIQENLAQAEAFIREAARRGAKYIQTPENTLVMESDARSLLQKTLPEFRQRAEAGEEAAQNWVRQFVTLGQRLGFALDPARVAKPALAVAA